MSPTARARYGAAEQACVGWRNFEIERVVTTRVLAGRAIDNATLGLGFMGFVSDGCSLHLFPPSLRGALLIAGRPAPDKDVNRALIVHTQ